jgi:RNA polymerase sigma-70 factor (ECF subfamily)
VYLTQYHRLWEFAYSFVRSDEVAEDVVHDTFATLWYNRARLEIESTIDAYLFGAIRHRALNVLRHARTTERTLPSATGPVPGMGSAAASPDGTTAAGELDAALHDAIAKLPPGQQQAIVLHWRHGLSNPEIARVMETSVATVAVHIARAREALRRVAGRYVDL